MKKIDLGSLEVPLFPGFSREENDILIPQKILEHPLIRCAGMNLVWQRETAPTQKNPISPPSRLYIGNLLHSPQLYSALQAKHLDSFLEELTQIYRDIYGGPPWNEYVICTNRECANVLGIQDVYGNEAYTPLVRLENSHPYFDEFSCQKCSAQLDFFYSPIGFLEQIKKAFRDKMIATFLFDENLHVLGLSLGCETTIQGGWQDKFLSGYGDQQKETVLPYSDYIAEIGNFIGSEVQENAKAFNSAEWAISFPARRSGASLALYYANNLAAFFAMSENGEDVPVIGHSLLQSKALEIFSAIGFAHGSIIPGTEQVRVYSTLKNLLRGICDFSTRTKK